MGKEAARGAARQVSAGAKQRRSVAWGQRCGGRVAGPVGLLT